MKLTRREILLTSAGAAVTSLWSHTSDADEPDACPPGKIDAALADVARARAGVTTLTGPFTQERTIGLLAAKVRSTGTLTLVRPDRLRWELAPPDDVVYWVTPEGLGYRSPTGKGRVPAANQRIAAALDDLRILLGGDLTTLRARYDLGGSCRPDGRISFRAVPKPGSSSSFQEIRFMLAPDLVSPESTTIVEGPRDKTEIHFGTLQKNVPISAALMTAD
jgi:outer membrane lipoprotein-sorting protein